MGRVPWLVVVVLASFLVAGCGLLPGNEAPTPDLAATPGGSPSPAAILARTSTPNAAAASPTPQRSTPTPVSTRPAPTSAPVAASPSNPSSASGGTVVVANTGGDGVILRASKGSAGEKVAALPEGTELTITGPSEQADGRAWLPVTIADGTAGWVAAEYTAEPGTATIVVPTPAPVTPEEVATPEPAAPAATPPPPATPPSQATTPPAQPTTPPSQPTQAPATPAPTAQPRPTEGSGQQTADSAPCLDGQIKAEIDGGIYHTPDQRDYARTKENVACFDSEAAAQEAGYHKARR